MGMAYLAPAVVFVLVFTVYPLGQMVWMSFHNGSLITPPRWVGLANYRELFSDALGSTGTKEGTYIGMVRKNVDTIVGALK